MKLRVLFCYGFLLVSLSALAVGATPTPVKNRVTFTGKFLQLNQATQPPRLLKPVVPAYPPQWRGLKIGGTAKIAYIVNVEGKAEEVQIAEATDKAFGVAARDAVKQWEFKPGTRDGQPVRVCVAQVVTFDPKDL